MTVRTVAAAGAAAALLVGGAFLTPAVADHIPLAPEVRGTLDGTTDRRPSKVSADGIELKTKTVTRVRALDLRYAPGAVSGWHSHPGVVVAVVREGAVVRQVGCTTEVFEVGEAFTEVGPHNVRNSSQTEAAVLAITHIFPASMEGELRRAEVAPDCD